MTEEVSSINRERPLESYDIGISDLSSAEAYFVLIANSRRCADKSHEIIISNFSLDVQAGTGRGEVIRKRTSQRHRECCYHISHFPLSEQPWWILKRTISRRDSQISKWSGDRDCGAEPGSKGRWGERALAVCARGRHADPPRRRRTDQETS